MVTKSEFVWMNGKFRRWNDAKVHVLTHALHYGSAVFEGIRSYKIEDKTAVFRLDDHIERLFYSSKIFGLKIKFSKKQVRQAVLDVLKKNNLKDAYIRPLIYFSYGGISVYPKDNPSDILIISLPKYDNSPRKLKVMVSAFRKCNLNSQLSGAKISGNYVNSILAMREARKNGFDEALMIDDDGFISEGPTENLFMVKDNKLIIPVSKSALHGITEDTVLKITKDLEIKHMRKKVGLYEVIKANELFYCGTARQISPIVSVNRKNINKGKVGNLTSRMMKEYRRITSGYNKKYRGWLTFVE